MVRHETPNYSLTSRFYLLVALGAALAGCADTHGDTAEEGAPSALLVAVDTVTPSDGYTIQRQLAGRVEAARERAVGFELQGLVLSVGAQEGDTVKAGQELATLDRARLNARRAEALAALEQARSASELAARTLERSEDAAGFDGISAQELDLARDAASAAAAQTAGARARLNSVQVDLDKSSLTAPYPAVIIRRHVDEGQIVGPGQPVFDLQEIAAPEVRIGVPGNLAATLKPGDERLLTVDGRRVSARVRSVLPVRDVVTRTVDAIFVVDEGNGVIPGDLARLDVEQTVRENGFWLPVGALAEGSRGLWTAYVAVPLDSGRTAENGGTHTLTPRAVEILYQETSRVFVRGALKAGDRYVTGGLHRLVPELEVRVRDAQVATAGGEAAP
ncbi:MAG: efflux RND transporter periplasmic adaptor subunit [Pseudomonadota bacterium]